jgi:hypothetical protein
VGLMQCWSVSHSDNVIKMHNKIKSYQVSTHICTKEPTDNSGLYMTNVSFRLRSVSNLQKHEFSWMLNEKRFLQNNNGHQNLCKNSRKHGHRSLSLCTVS